MLAVVSAVTAVAQVKNISPGFAEQKINKKKVTVLDVRTKEEFREGHLQGAINIDVLDSASFVQQIGQLKKRKTYLVYCRSGKRSVKASDILLQHGFKHIWNMEGGITAWKGKTIQ